jgi:hypothetical protein
MKAQPRSITKAIRRNCLECSGGNAKYVTWCPNDGLHSTRCEFWLFRFGIRPETAAQRYGAELVTPELMPIADVDLDSLPSSPNRAAERLAKYAFLSAAQSDPEAQISTQGAEVVL